MTRRRPPLPRAEGVETLGELQARLDLWDGVKWTLAFATLTLTVLAVLAGVWNALSLLSLLCVAGMVVAAHKADVLLRELEARCG